MAVLDPKAAAAKAGRLRDATARGRKRGGNVRRGSLLLPLALLAWAMVAGCAHTERDQTVCPEYRGRACLSLRDCAFDRARGCMVCQCHQDDRTRQQRGLPEPEPRGSAEPMSR
jgi:hypothetical protein